MFRRASVISALTLAAAVSLPGLTRAANAAGPRVLVIPFTTLNIPDNQQWIGRAVSENIIADLGHANAYAPIAFQGQLVVEDNSTAVSLAHKADAQFVVRGAAQQVDQNIRLTAQMIDARSGDTLTTASVTGPVNDLLKLEDQLSAQLDANAASAQQAQTAAQQPAQQPAAAQPVDGVPAAGPVVYTPNPAYTTPVYTPTYTPGYSYVPYDAPVYSGGYTADYGYPYYGYGGPIVFFGGSYYSGWGRGWNHGGYSHGGWDHGGGNWNHGGGWDHGGGGWNHGGSGGGIHTGGGGIHTGGGGIHTGGGVSVGGHGGFSGGFTGGGHGGIGGGHR